MSQAKQSGTNERRIARSQANLAAGLMLAITSSVHAQAYGPDYRCTVERVEEQGRANPFTLDLYRGKTFLVHRRSGMMVGGVGLLKNSYFDEQTPQVIDYGQRGVNSFKAITTQSFDRGGGSHVYVLVINEWIEESAKPFTFLSDTTVWFGRCEHSGQ
ncbi:hypothetical protein D9M68_100260 [compost metagenome]